MDEGQIIDIAQRAIYVASITAIPILIACLAVGIVISIFQAATQIHEQTLVFIPKIVVVVILLAVAGSWISGQLAEFTREAFGVIANL
ncbi:MAG TPA: flagellar biosynthesis protein FliQ [Clostridia bacterium]|nr:flagellar biosynthesis protein FliQ [Clostridia bacterium]